MAINYKRLCIIDIFDYSGNKICNLYDSNSDVSGQASGITEASSRNGWREQSFTLPTVIETENGKEENPRLQFMKADYKVRLINEDETEWYIISEPKITHSNKSRTVTALCGHVSQQLKYKNLGLVFSDDEGNNVGTPDTFLDVILEGTGWTKGNVSKFYEDDGKTIKYRSLVASEKTGAFSLISKMCELFDAKPIFRGDSKTVDIVPMNPFSEPKDGTVPDVTTAKGVIELHYGNNVKNITRTLNTENLRTKLYAYGAYGDKTNGYCGIDECTHKELKFRINSSVDPGTEIRFQYKNAQGVTVTKYFKPTEAPLGQITSQHTFTFSQLDPASMMYVYDGSVLYVEGSGSGSSGSSGSSGGDGELVPEDPDPSDPGIDPGLNYEVDMAYKVYDEPSAPNLSYPSVTYISNADIRNWFSFVMDFNYYDEIGLLSDDALQAIAHFQMRGPKYLEDVYNASLKFAEEMSKVTELVGSVDYVKLQPFTVNTNGTYVTITLDTAGYDNVTYTTEYNVKPDKRFKWKAATQLYANGDAINQEASVVYLLDMSYELDQRASTYYKLSREKIGGGSMVVNRVVSSGTGNIYNSSNDYLWHKTYIKSVDNVNNPKVITLWLKSSDWYFGSDKRSAPGKNLVGYIFKTNNINGYIGSFESAYESVLMNLDSITTFITTKHPVYFVHDKSKMQSVGSINGYAWCYVFKPEGYGQLFLYYSGMDSRWLPVYSVPYYKDDDYVWIADDWGSSLSYQYHYRVFDGTMARVQNKSDSNGRWIRSEFENTEQMRISDNTGIIVEGCEKRDVIHAGIYENYTLNVSDVDLTKYYYYNESTRLYKGRYAFDIGDGNLHVFSTTRDLLPSNGKLVFNTTKRIISQFYGTSETTLEIKSYVKSSMVTAPQFFKSVPTYGRDMGFKHGVRLCSDGTTKDDNQWGNGTSAFIRCLSNVSYKFESPYYVRDKIYRINFYTKTKKLISSSTSFYNYPDFRTPVGAYYFRLEAQIYTMENNGGVGVRIVMRNPDDAIVIDNEIAYVLCDFRVLSDEVKGLVPMMNRFRYTTDRAYETYYKIMKDAQEQYDSLERNIQVTLGELYREGYLSKPNYVQGDEDKLYADALYAVNKISKPEASYQVSYIDPYGSNRDMMYYASPISNKADWPRITTEYAAHLVDPEISLNLWAYIDKSSICYDNPWKSNIEINTNLSLLNQHEFKDVMAHIAEVASEAKGKLSIYDRSMNINKDGQIASSDISGTIDSSVTEITNGTITKHTDTKGNDVWVSPDGLSAITMNGGVMRIASSKDSTGNWIWREFGSGNGFNASEINHGQLSGERLIDASVGIEKLTPSLVQNLMPDVITSLFESLFTGGVYIGTNKILQIKTLSATISQTMTLIDTPVEGYSISHIYVLSDDLRLAPFADWNSTYIYVTVPQDPGKLIHYVLFIIWIK